MQTSGTENSAHCVLLVEDNPGDALLFQELLAELNAPFVVEHVERLDAALARLKQGGISLILSDLTLPDSTGIETFHRLHAAAPAVPIIVLSGLTDESLALQTLEEGAQDYLVKGHVDSHLLTRAMRYAIKRADSERALAEERNLLRRLIDNLLDAVYVKDAKGRYLIDNIAHRRGLGLSRAEDVVGRTAYDFFDKTDAAKFQQADEAVMTTGEPVVNQQEAVIARSGERRWLSTTKVPLRDSEGAIVGVVGIGRDITHRKLSDEKLARYTEELREKNAQMQDDLHMAHEIQQAFLPQQFPSFPPDVPPEESLLEFHKRYFPSGAVSGDFFHVLPLSQTAAGLFICDVMGHGVQAALVTAIQRALIEELQPVAWDPAQFLTQINRALVSILRRPRTPMFASAFYVVVDLEKGTLTYANAGHPYPLHIRRSARQVELLDEGGKRPGPAMGVFAGARYEAHTREVEEADTIMVFTDGVYEVEAMNGDLYEQDDLQRSVQRLVERSTPEIFDETLAGIAAFSGDQGFVDDVCMVGMDVRRLARGRDLGIQREQ